MKLPFVSLAIVVFMAFSLSVSAQDDELPPPSSKPRNTEEVKTDERKPPNPNEFEGFKKRRKIDFSKFIIEPNFNLSIGQGRIDAGLSPYVGYKIWEPKSPKAKGVNNGLFAGAGITYFYTGFTNIDIVGGNGARLGSAKAHFHTYGGGVFLQYNIWRGLFARVRFEVLHRDLADLNSQPVPKNPNNLSEGFYFSRIQKTIPSLLIGVGYNLLQSKNFFMPIMVSYNVLHTVTDKTYSIYPRGVVVQLGFINLF